MFRNPESRRRLLVGSLLTFAVLLIAAATWCYKDLTAALDHQARENLNLQWAAMKGFLRLQSNGKVLQPYWYYDSDDPPQVAIVNGIRQFFLLADRQGRLVQRPPAYQDVAVESPSQISSRVSEALASPDVGKSFWISRRSLQGAPLLIRSGVVFDETRRSPYYVSIGVRLDQYHSVLRSFTWIYFGVIACALILGWLVGRIIPRQLSV
jgi:hypothetical protein